MFSKNLKYLRQKKGIEQLELANILGRKSASTISEWESGKYTPKIGVLTTIANYFNVDIDDLMKIDIEYSLIHNPKQDTTEITNIYTQLNPPRQQVVLDTATAQLKEQKAEESKALSIKEETTKYKAKKKKRLYTIDIVEKLAAGYGHYLADTPQEYTAIIDINPNTLPSYNYASLVSGDSMLPDYEEGDVVLISQGYDFQNGYVYALIYEDESYLKKVYIESDYIILKSLNPNYKDIKIKTGENLDIGLRIIGRVIHSLKPLNVKNKY